MNKVRHLASIFSVVVWFLSIIVHMIRGNLLHIPIGFFIMSQVDGLYYNLGMSSRGIQLSGGMGREMANLIVSGCTSEDMFSYNINR